MIEYKPDRQPNRVYRDTLEFVLRNGYKSESAHSEPSWMYFSPPKLRFDIAKDGVPLITERNYKGIFKSSIGELLAFDNGARTVDQLRKFGVSDRFWTPWVTAEKCQKRGLPTGDLGDGSYGAVFHDFPTPEGPFNQVEAVIKQIQERPYDRSHRISNWYLPYLVRNNGSRQRTVVTPCHGDRYFRVYNGKLNLHMTQHKADLVTGLPSNLIQHTASLLAMAHVTGWEPGELVVDLVDAHFYLMDKITEEEVTPREAIEIMLSRKPLALPTLQLREDAPLDYFAIRPEHFILDEYEPHPSIPNIITAI